MTLYSKEDFKKLIPVSDEVFAKIETYHELLVKWQKAINLVSPKTLGESWHRHFLDSAQVAKFIPDTGVLADIGSGAGFPGLVVAMMKSQLQVHMIESDERKGQFMRTVSRETGLKNVTIHTNRIETAHGLVQPDIVTARALASLEELLGYVRPWAESNSDLVCCFMKGRGAEEEIETARKIYKFTLEKSQSMTDNEASILLLKGIAF